ncbi:MAG: hypothetical protein KH452_06630 [Clostridiales bacterium]|nr:hypothetical protein [Clostridiales bacterium]
MDKKRLAVNMAAQLLAFAVNMGISFFLAPIIEAQIANTYGFIDLANKFVLYAQIVVSALNTMASRFVTIHIHRGEEKEANEYFSSVFFGNVLMAGIFLLPALVIVLFMGYMPFLDVPENLLLDVQLLWAFVFGNFFLSIITSVYGVSTYATNRLDLTSIRTMYADLLRILFLFVTFTVWKPTLWFVGAASVISTAYIAFWNRRFTRQLLPGIHIRTAFFRWKKVWELISLGAWNSLTRLGQVLLDGVDILLAGALITDGGASMTLLSLAKMVPTSISSLMGTVVGVFNPQITIAYAEGDKDNLVQIIKSCNRILIFIMSIPIAFLTAYGMDFYALWMPTKDPVMLHRLSLLSVGVLYVSMSIQVLYHVFIITKKVKWNSLVMVGSGVFSAILSLVLLSATNLGVMSFALSSMLTGLLRNLIFTPVYAARCLEIRWSRFYSDILLGLFSIGTIVILGILSRMVYPVRSWGSLIVTGMVMGPLALLVNFFIILRKTERDMVLQMVRSKLKGAA